MTRNETIASLRRETADFRDRGVTAMYLFGSTARNQASPSSDIDLFVDYDPERFDFVQLVRLRDMLESIDAVAEMTTAVDFAGYGRDLKLRRAIERCIEIVSEASRHIPPDLKDRFPEQPWPEIAAIGNLLRHDYQRVDDLIIW